MRDSRRIQSAVRAERAVLVGVILPGAERGQTRYDPLAELAALAKAAGAEIAGRLIQKRTKICAGTYIGHGKAEELAGYVQEKEADVVIFDNDLSPSQIRELEEHLKHRVIDRTELILDIFASRARTEAARLQVELAQLEYTAPRLRGMWTHLERIAGAGGATGAGAVGGIGTRGPGERQIEIDRRLVEKRVSFLRRQLAAIDKRKLREVRSRRDHFTISLVGYTNAGKSTLMNVLTGAGAYVADKLFATLDTKTRRWDLGDGQTVLLSDTVGFVRDLPHHLVASFKATLEEVVHSDLLLHVVDAASPDSPGQIRAVEVVLSEIGCHETPVLMVLNKTDAVGENSGIHVLRLRLPEAVEVSAARGEGVDVLADRVRRQVQSRYVRLTIDSEAANGRLLAYLRKYGRLLGQEYRDSRVRLDVRLPPAEVQRVIDLGGVVVED